jgi:hypothetical protein
MDRVAALQPNSEAMGLKKTPKAPRPPAYTARISEAVMTIV